MAKGAPRRARAVFAGLTWIGVGAHNPRGMQDVEASVLMASEKNAAKQEAACITAACPPPPLVENSARTNFVCGADVKPGSPPCRNGDVVVTFLRDAVHEAWSSGTNRDPVSTPGMGFAELERRVVESHSVPAGDMLFHPNESRSDTDSLQQSKFVTFKKDGFEVMNLPASIISDDLVRKARSIRWYEGGDRSEQDAWIRDTQTLIGTLENFVRHKYAFAMNLDVDELITVASRKALPRAAGRGSNTAEQRGQILANPVFHVDYLNSDKAYEQQVVLYGCANDQCPLPLPFDKASLPRENLLDVINIWFPLEEVEDWPLGFVPLGTYSHDDLQPLNLVLGMSQAASTSHKQGMTVYYRNKMKPGEAYMFRTRSGPGGTGILHGSFRTTSEHKVRLSIELRMMIFHRERRTEEGA